MATRMPISYLCQHINNDTISAFVICSLPQQAPRPSAPAPGRPASCPHRALVPPTAPAAFSSSARPPRRRRRHATAPPALDRVACGASTPTTLPASRCKCSGAWQADRRLSTFIFSANFRFCFLICVLHSGPVPVLVMSLIFIASVFMLHIWGKYTRS